MNTDALFCTLRSADIAYLIRSAKQAAITRVIVAVGAETRNSPAIGSAASVSRTINTTFTLLNRVIGWYIHEYEQQGADRATNGEAMVIRLAEVLAARGMRDLAPRTLRQCHQFYTAP